MSGADTLRARLASRRPVVGAFFGYPAATLAEYAATLPWEFLLFDTEHGGVRSADADDLVRACERRECPTLARVPLAEAAEVQRFLDAGVDGVMFPQVDSPEHAQRAVELAKYPPQGRRGYAGPRTETFGAAGDLADWLATENRRGLVIAQIESGEGLRNVEAIAATPGIDCLFIGPGDLSIALGTPRRFDSAAMIAAEQRIAEACLAGRKWLGAYAGTAARLSHYSQLGATLLAASIDGALALGTRHLLDEFRGRAAMDEKL